MRNVNRGTWMKITQELYKYSMERGVLDVSDLKEFAHERLDVNYKYLYTKFITRLLSQGKLVRIRQGLYAAKNVFDPYEKDTDRYLIASKIKPDYYLGFHTALELYGAAYSEFNSVHVTVPRNSYFHPFVFEGSQYVPVTRQVDDVETEVQRMTRKYHTILLSSPSRTLVDCIDRFELCGGYEEVIKSLQGLGGVDIGGVIKILDVYDKDILDRAVGYILSLLIDGSPYYGHISEEDLAPIKDRINKNKRYLLQNKPSKYVDHWNLYVPKDFESLPEGIR